MTIISRSSKIISKLKEDGKVISLNKPEDLDAVDEINNEMENVRREYRMKAAASWISAKYVILD